MKIHKIKTKELKKFVFKGDDKIELFNNLLKTSQYYYYYNLIFFFENDNLKYFGQFSGDDYIRSITFYDIDKKEQYEFLVKFNACDNFRVGRYIPHFLKTDEGKQYYHYFEKKKESDNYIAFEVEGVYYIFKKGVSKCLYMEKKLYQTMVHDYVNGISYWKERIETPEQEPKQPLQPAEVLMINEEHFLFFS